jgi:hypothetical protein
MALSRTELKAVVKDLLLEILSEGVGSAGVAQLGRSQPAIRGAVTESRRPTSRGSVAPKSKQFDPQLDTPARGTVPSGLSETIKHSAGGNPLMASIFADTAATTLQTMMEHGDRGVASASSAPEITQKEQINGTPEEVFGEDVSARWADLAFAADKKVAR